MVCHSWYAVGSGRMKWTNKGHEFDEIGNKFKNIGNVIIYGAGEYGTKCAKMLEGIGANFLFADRVKFQNGRYMGHKVISPDQIIEELKLQNSIIVLALGRDNAGRALIALQMHGLRYGVEIFDVHNFMEVFFHIYAAYRYNKVLMYDVSVMVTYKCSLKCKNCMACIPYMERTPEVSFDKFKEDIDLLFSKIDYVIELGLGGGEMFLLKDLDRYISYVMDNYYNQFEEVQLLTNGTIIPNQNTIETIKRYNLRVYVSGYDTVPGWISKYDKLKQKMDSNNIPIEKIPYESWVDMGWREKNYTEHVDELFSMCGMKCRIVQDGKLNYCIHGALANKALYDLDISTDEYNLKTTAEGEKVVLMEYNLGFSESGEMKMCHFCNGYININQKVIPVAEQLS